MTTYDLYNVTCGEFIATGYHSRCDTIESAKMRCGKTSCDYTVIERPSGNVVFSTRKDWVRK